MSRLQNTQLEAQAEQGRRPWLKYVLDTKSWEGLQSLPKH